MNDESRRYTFTARRPAEVGGGNCSIVVRRVGQRVELLLYGLWEAAAVLTLTQAVDVSEALSRASE
ncbi:hypothetical protein H0B56_12880 [Haloechinothrix sp. YIM 98757]|uniref:Uncharacterized protein n=1 Tax=Haloechinothrix aidingensis TaxID=2752311 RepID=A0A838AB38_9PSEU|nr:hypothetical protein [Haloechinothrix aidingensis]MBA0126437.1 hypothetical protein [Haloechinothrix aidingensis]